MITIVGALIGFVSSAVPEVLKLYQDSKDKKHELALLQTQMQWHKSQKNQRLDELEIESSAAQMQAIYSTVQPTHLKWIDGLAGSVRPLITYAFFLVYGLVKAGQWYSIFHFGFHGLEALVQVWGEEDQALFAAVMSFWFGQRALLKRGKKNL